MLEEVGSGTGSHDETDATLQSDAFHTVAGTARPATDESCAGLFNAESQVQVFIKVGSRQTIPVTVGPLDKTKDVKMKVRRNQTK